MRLREAHNIDDASSLMEEGWAILTVLPGPHFILGWPTNAGNPVLEFLNRVSPKKLEEEALQRQDWDSGTLTEMILDVLKESAGGTQS